MDHEGEGGPVLRGLAAAGVQDEVGHGEAREGDERRFHTGRDGDAAELQDLPGEGHGHDQHLEKIRSSWGMQHTTGGII